MIKFLRFKNSTKAIIDVKGKCEFSLNVLIFKESHVFSYKSKINFPLFIIRMRILLKVDIKLGSVSNHIHAIHAF